MDVFCHKKTYTNSSLPIIDPIEAPNMAALPDHNNANNHMKKKQINQEISRHDLVAPH